jgi:hypothetical protein
MWDIQVLDIWVWDMSDTADRSGMIDNNLLP